VFDSVGEEVGDGGGAIVREWRGVFDNGADFVTTAVALITLDVANSHDEAKPPAPDGSASAVASTLLDLSLGTETPK
jgi:hypothetical protein